MSEAPRLALRDRIAEVIYGVDTRAGRIFDVVLLWCILVSVVAVMLESVRTIAAAGGVWLRVVEWAFTILFTLEYLVRLAVARRPGNYARSFFGVVDLLAVVPTWASLFIEGSQSLLVIRGLRLLRVFRVLKLARFLGEGEVLLAAMRASREKIVLFAGSVVTVAVILGALMYLIEGEANGFTSIPRSVYWAIVTMTTVGYGDIAPQTTIGQILSVVVMLLGYGIIAVPTGVFSAELVQVQIRKHERAAARRCPACASTGHDDDARYCKRCAAPLPED